MSTPERRPPVPPGPSSRCSLCLYRSLNIGVPPNPIFGEIYMMPAGTPILVLKEGTRRERGKGAQFNNIAAAKAVADAVRSTLGPRGMDKMLVDSLGDVVITNDGVTILKEIDIEHPAAKMLVEVAKTQDEEAGDGTTTAVVLAGELLKKAEDLIEQNIQPTVIAAGYRQAADKAREVLEKVAMKISVKDLDTLKKVAMTAMSSKSASAARTCSSARKASTTSRSTTSRSRKSTPSGGSRSPTWRSWRRPRAGRSSRSSTSSRRTTSATPSSSTRRRSAMTR